MSSRNGVSPSTPTQVKSPLRTICLLSWQFGFGTTKLPAVFSENAHVSGGVAESCRRASGTWRSGVAVGQARATRSAERIQRSMLWCGISRTLVRVRGGVGEKPPCVYVWCVLVRACGNVERENRPNGKTVLVLYLICRAKVGGLDYGAIFQ